MEKEFDHFASSYSSVYEEKGLIFINQEGCKWICLWFMHDICYCIKKLFKALN